MPYFLIMTAVLGVAAIISKRWGFYVDSSKEEVPGRYESIDGLRGILALGVFFQHAVTSLAYYQTGSWQITELKFYRFLGGESVILFFMITSFLYWSKAIAQKGQLNAYSIYRNRLYRLAPMYLFTAALVIFFALTETGFNIQYPVQFLRDVLSWLTLGIITPLQVNGIDIIHINAGIHWTLHFEWIFYILLPLAALMLQNSRMHLLIIPLLAVLALTPDKGYWMIFLFGMAAAHLVRFYPKKSWMENPLFSLIPMVGLILVYLSSYKPYGVLQYCITFFVFLSFIYGAHAWGLLKTRATRFLGTISYSIYLMHGIVLYLALKVINDVYPIVSLSPLAYWLVMAVCAVIIIGLSSLTYKYIEYPFLKMYRSKLSDKVM